MSRIYVGNLPPDIRDRELEDVFARYGRIRNIDVKLGVGRGPAFAFVEYDDARDADDAIRGEDGRSSFGGDRIRVEMSRGRVGGYADRGYDRGGDRYSDRYGDRYARGGYDDRRGGGGRIGLGPSPYGPSRKTNYRVFVTGLEPSMSWQDLKDHFRDHKVEVTHADVNRDGTGTASFATEEDMEKAVERADDTVMKNLRGECRIRVKADGGGDYDDRRRSPADRSPLPRRDRSRSRSASPKYSPPPRERERDREDSREPRDRD